MTTLMGIPLMAEFIVFLSVIGLPVIFILVLLVIVLIDESHYEKRREAEKILEANAAARLAVDSTLKKLENHLRKPHD